MGRKRKRENSQQRISRRNRARILSVGRFLSLTYIVIDRDRDRAVFCTLGLAMPLWRVVSPLSLIMSAQINKREREEKDALYGIVVRLSRSGRVRFNCRSRDVATKTLQALQQHLQVETRSSGRTQANFDGPQDENAAPLRQFGSTHSS